MSTQAQKSSSSATGAHFITYAGWQREMEQIADLAARAGVTAPVQAPLFSAACCPRSPMPGSGVASASFASAAVVAPSWDRLLGMLRQYPYGADTSSHQTTTNNLTHASTASASTPALSGADALFHALARVDRVLLHLAQENRVTDLALSHMAEAQTLMSRALLYRHAHLFFQQHMDAVMTYERVMAAQPTATTSMGASASPSLSARAAASAAVVETYPGLVAQVARLYTTTMPAPAGLRRGGDGPSEGNGGEAGSGSGGRPLPSQANNNNINNNNKTTTTATVIEPWQHLLPSSSVTAAAALAQYQLLTAGSEAVTAGMLADVPHSHTHAAWFVQMQQRQAHFLASEARDYQRAARLWRRVEQERVRLVAPTQDEALALSVLCTTMACGAWLRDELPEAHNPHSRWQYEHAVHGTEALTCHACSGVLPVATPLHLVTISSLLFELAQSLEVDFACVEQAVNFYELAAVVVLRAVPNGWTLGQALSTELTVSEALRAWEAARAASSAAAAPPSSPRTGAAAVGAALASTETSSWWGDLVNQLASTFTRDAATTTAAEAAAALEAQRERAQEERRVRAELAARQAAAEAAEAASQAREGRARMYPVYAGHWMCFEKAMEAAIRGAAQGQEYALALRYGQVLLEAVATETARVARAAASKDEARLCVCTSAVWRRREEVAARTTTTTSTTTTTPLAATCEAEVAPTREASDACARAFSVVRTRCLVRQVLMHLLLHDDRTHASPSLTAEAESVPVEEACRDDSSTRAAVPRVKRHIRTVTASLVKDVGDTLCAVVDLAVEADQAAGFVDAAREEDVWRCDFMYPQCRRDRDQARARPCLGAAPLEALPRMSPVSSSSSSSSSSLSLSASCRPSGAFAYRQSAAYAALKKRACRAAITGTDKDAEVHIREDGTNAQAGAAAQVGDEARHAPTFSASLWDLVASLLALANVTAHALTTPLQCDPARLVPLCTEDAHPSESGRAEPLDGAAHLSITPAVVRRHLDAAVGRLEKALWALGMSDSVFGALQQRLRARLCMPVTLQF